MVSSCGQGKKGMKTNDNCKQPPGGNDLQKKQPKLQSQLDTKNVFMSLGVLTALLKINSLRFS